MNKHHLLIISIIIIFFSGLLALQKIPPNWFFGFRSPSSYQSDIMWYEINSLFGLLCVVFSIITAVIVMINPGWLHSYRPVPLLTVFAPVILSALICTFIF